MKANLGELGNAVYFWRLESTSRSCEAGYRRHGSDGPNGNEIGNDQLRFLRCFRQRDSEWARLKRHAGAEAGVGAVQGAEFGWGG